MMNWASSLRFKKFVWLDWSNLQVFKWSYLQAANFNLLNFMKLRFNLLLQSLSWYFISYLFDYWLELSLLQLYLLVMKLYSWCY